MKPTANGEYPLRLDQWNDDCGDVLWYCWRDGEWLEEAPYVGSPMDLGQTVECHTASDQPAARFNVGGWPGYHTHYLPLPNAPARPD